MNNRHESRGFQPWKVTSTANERDADVRAGQGALLRSYPPGGPEGVSPSHHEQGRSTVATEAGLHIGKHVIRDRNRGLVDDVLPALGCDGAGLRNEIWIGEERRRDRGQLSGAVVPIDRRDGIGDLPSACEQENAPVEAAISRSRGSRICRFGCSERQGPYAVRVCSGVGLGDKAAE